jgi:GNAT superfamily N-acetyltransferase
VVVELQEHEREGGIYLLAVDPKHQRRGIGGGLTEYALAWIKEQGMDVAYVGTGGDPGHGPARRVYERAGFSGFPVVQYMRLL